MRKGDLDIFSLFSICNVTADTTVLQTRVSEKLGIFSGMLKKEQPEIDIGPHCGSPYQCPFTGYCWRKVPEYSVFDIGGLSTGKKFELYHKGIITLNDIPKDLPLSEKQRIQVDCEIKGNKIINYQSIRSFLNTLWFPLYFLDFETFQQPVPLFDNLRPYQQIPFQYSLHSMEKKSGELKHREFLAEEGDDPRQDIAAHLIKDIPDNACVFAYNQGFEKTVIRNLAEQFPKYAGKLDWISSNIRDLMVPFQKKHYYLPEMKGRYSIKAVLPAVVPGLDYNDLEISNGGDAMTGYSVLPSVKDRKERERIRKALLEYCKLDTLAMVEIWRVLNTVVGP